MAAKRTFIAIELPENIRTYLGKVRTLLAPVSEGVKWVHPSLMHITLKFLGETPDWMLDDVRTHFRTIVSGQAAVTMQLKQLGQFPKQGDPRVFWAGVRKIPPAVYRLSDELNSDFVSLGFDDTGKRFSPHITLGRAKRKLHEDMIASYYDINLEEKEFTAVKIIWYESCHLDGKLAYLPLEEIALTM